MPSVSKVAQVALAVAMPTTVILLYWWYKQASKDEDTYGRPKVVTTKQTRIEMMIPCKAVGAVIGRQGSTIKEIQKASGARVSFNDKGPRNGNTGDSDEMRSLIIHGTAEAAQQAELMIHQVIAEMPEVLKEEIEVPNYSIGNLIGKGGKSIREIQASSGARINIDRQENVQTPDQPRVLELRGSRAQIDTALVLIEEKLEEVEKFRAKLSVAASKRDVRPSQPNKLRPVAIDNGQWDVNVASSQDTLPDKGGFFEVFVSAVENPGHFWVQLVGQKALRLEELQNEITAFAGTEEAKKNYCVTSCEPGQLVAARYEAGDSIFYRAKVLGPAPEDGKLDLYFVDFGDNTFADMAEIIKLRSDFASFPFQAVECQVEGVEPQDGSWSEEAIECFESLACCGQWQVVNCRVKGYRQSDQRPMVQLVNGLGDKDVDIALTLVEKGYALDCDKPQQTHNGDNISQRTFSANTSGSPDISSDSIGKNSQSPSAIKEYGSNGS